MKLTVTFIITLSVLNFYCQNDNSKNSQYKNNVTDSVIWDIPEWYSTSMFSQKRDRQLRTLLKLDSLKNGFEKQILLLVATLNEFGIEPSKESDLVLLEEK